MGIIPGPGHPGGTAHYRRRAVYHDLGNLNFTLIAEGRSSAELDLHLFCQPVAAALKRLGFLWSSAAGTICDRWEKFSGSSQRICEGRVLHHGTLLFDSDLTVLSRALLRVPPDKLPAKGVASVRGRM